MAYATIAGLPVQAGLYVATVPMVVYALAGTSRPLPVSTTSTLAALTAAAVIPLAGGDPSRALVAASTLAALSGLLLGGVGLLRLGTWPTRPTRPLGSCCWTWTPSPTSTSPPWTSWPAWMPTCAGVASPCG